MMASQTHDRSNQAVTQTAVLRAMTMEQRWRVAQSLYASAREWKACVLRSLHPEWSEVEIREAVRRSFLHAGR
jgi:hypothetical protein